MKSSALLSLLGFIFFISSPVPARENCVDAFANAKSITTRSELDKSYAGLYESLSRPARGRYARAAKTIDDLLENPANPYTFLHSVAVAANRQGHSVFDEVYLLLEALSKEQMKDRIKALNDWTRTEDHALLLYDVLFKIGMRHFRDEQSWLLKHNRFFVDAIPIRGPPEQYGSLVTFAFEKEGSEKEINLLYRSPNYRDEEWLSLSDADRLMILQSGTSKKKQFLPANEIAPTALKPEFLGGYSEELPTAQSSGYSWEISHKQYEISLSRLMSEAAEISRMFKNSHSFHFHVVFELAKKYRFFKQFSRWTKRANDFVTIQRVPTYFRA